MPRFKPSILISDCWGSVGDTTFYHVDGKCYYKKKPKCSFPGTAEQAERLSVHRRALAAWRELEHPEQILWHEYARKAPSHRPPFDGTSHISGHNLFVSAYHNFSILGNEHVPSPKPYEHFPPFSVEFISAEVISEDLKFSLRVFLPRNGTPERYHLLAKIQLTDPGYGVKPGKMRNVLASAPCNGENGTIELEVKQFRDIWRLDLPAYQVHIRYVLLDRDTGYRNNWAPLSFSFSI